MRRSLLLLEVWKPYYMWILEQVDESCRKTNVSRVTFCKTGYRFVETS